MKVRKFKLVRALVLLMVVLVTSTVFAACVDTNQGEDIIDNMSVDLSKEESIVDVSDEEISTPEGHTDAPKVSKVINVSPSVVAIFGSCEEGATVKISGGEEEVSVQARGSYFIASVELRFEAANLLELTATVEGKEESLPSSQIVYYNATADTRLDGNSVSVGTDSRLYFDRFVDDASGTNLYTVTQLKQIRTYVTNTINAYNDRASGAAVELIYVLVPNASTIYTDVIPDGVITETNTTVYDQVCTTLSQTRANVIDMRSIFRSLVEDETVLEHGGLYRVTDSSLTDYGAYLAYVELMNLIAENYPDAAPRGYDEFTVETVTEALGGNLVAYRDAPKELITEDIVRMIPNFDLNLGTNSTGSTMISSIRKYNDVSGKDFSYFTVADNTDEINGIAERWLVETERGETVDLPNALIYRDDSIFPIADILLERFDGSMIAKSGDFDINLSNAIQYAADDKNVVDYIIVFLSESNMDSAFSLAFTN